MGHVYADVLLRGAKGEESVKQVLVDTGATFTVLPKETLERIGASPVPTKVVVELGDGRPVNAESYALSIRVGHREAPAIALTFEGAKAVIGVESLESLGLRVNPTSQQLEEIRPRGIAYFYMNGRGFKERPL